MPTEQEQINALRDTIKKKAFKSITRRVPNKTQLKSDDKGRLRLNLSESARNSEVSFQVITSMKVLRNGEYRPVELFSKTEDLAAVAEWSELVNSFLSKLSEEIWHYKKHNYYIEKQVEDKLLERIRPLVRDLKTSADIRVALKEIRATLKGHLEFSKSGDYKYFYETNPNALDRIARENDVLSKIRNLYTELSTQHDIPIKTLPQRTVESNMAIALAAVDFWPCVKTEDEKEIMEELKTLYNKRYEKLPYKEQECLEQKIQETIDSQLKLLKPRVKIYVERLHKRFQVIDRPC